MKSDSSFSRMASFIAMVLGVLLMSTALWAGSASAQPTPGWNCGVRPMNGPTFVDARGVSCATAWSFVERATKKWMRSGFREKTLGYTCRATADERGNFRATCKQGAKRIKWAVAA